jgi:hypothetical protein
VGEFEHAAYGVVTVARRDAGLTFEFHGIKMPLSHFHYDRFDTPDDEAGRQVLAQLPDQSDGRSRRRGDLAGRGRGDIHRRVPAALTTDATLKMYAGTYLTPSGRQGRKWRSSPARALSIRGAGGVDLQPWRPAAVPREGIPGPDHLVHGRERKVLANAASAIPSGEFVFPRQP